MRKYSLNNKLVDDAIIIYRLIRSPERRVFPLNIPTPQINPEILLDCIIQKAKKMKDNK